VEIRENADMAQGKMKVKLTSGVMKSKASKDKKQNVGNFTKSSKKQGVTTKKRRNDKLDADARLRGAINSNIEKMMTERAVSYGAKMKVVKLPRKGEVKERRMHLMTKVVTKVAKELHTPSVDKLIEQMQVDQPSGETASEE
jgi:hypothetical protein